MGCAGFSGYHFTYFSRMGYQKKAIFLKPVVKKHVKEGHVSRSGYCLVQFLCFAVYFSPIFSRTGYHLKTKLWSRVKNFVCGHIPVQIYVKYPLDPSGPELV